MSKFAGASAGAQRPDEGVKSLSVEETNRLRAQLGLRPLRVDSPAAKSKPSEAVGLPSRDGTTHASPGGDVTVDEQTHRERVEAAKRKRRALAFARGGALDSLADEDTARARDTADGHPDTQRSTRSSERTVSSGRRRADAAQDADTHSQQASRNIVENSDERVRLRNLGDLNANESTVLTLEDTHILAKSGQHAADDRVVLVDTAERARARALKNADLRSGKALRQRQYNPRSIDPNVDKESILAKYDSDGTSDEEVTLHALNAASTSKAEAVRRHPEEQQDSHANEDTKHKRNDPAEQSRGVAQYATDYMSQAEFAGLFSKRKKDRSKSSSKSGRRKRKQRASNTAADALSVTAEEHVTAETRKQSDDDSDVDRADRAERLKALRETAAPTRKGDSVVHEDEEDEGLRESLLRARAIALKARAEDPADKLRAVSHALESTANEADEEKAPSDETAALGGEGDHAPVLLNDANQFVQSIHVSDGRVKSRQDGGGEWAPSAAKSSEHDAQVASHSPEVNSTHGETRVEESEAQSVTAAEQPEANGTETLGLFQALNTFRSLGELGKERSQYGRTRDRRSAAKSDPGEIKLVYTDEQGREVTPKEAFRLMSHKFHGKWPSQNKREARMRHELQRAELNRKSTTQEDPNGSAAVLREETRLSGKPHVVLSGAAAVDTISNGLGGKRTHAQSDEGASDHQTSPSASVSGKSASDREGTMKRSRSSEKLQFTLSAGSGPSLKRSRR